MCKRQSVRQQWEATYPSKFSHRILRTVVPPCTMYGMEGLARNAEWHFVAEGYFVAEAPRGRLDQARTRLMS